MNTNQIPNPIIERYVSAAVATLALIGTRQLDKTQSPKELRYTANYLLERGSEIRAAYKTIFEIEAKAINVGYGALNMLRAEASKRMTCRQHKGPLFPLIEEVDAAADWSNDGRHKLEGIPRLMWFGIPTDENGVPVQEVLYLDCAGFASASDVVSELEETGCAWSGKTNAQNLPIYSNVESNLHFVIDVRPTFC